MSEPATWPKKTRERHNHHFDSTIWNNLRFRDDDIIIATYAKSGTTWMQQIVAQASYGPDAELAVAEMSPWLDLRVPPQAVKPPVVEAQAHRRKSAEYEARAVELGPECARRLATGEGLD